MGKGIVDLDSMSNLGSTMRSAAPISLRRSLLPSGISRAAIRPLHGAAAVLLSTIRWMTRFFLVVFCLAPVTFPLAGCSDSSRWHNTDITGNLPDLRFTMIRAQDHKQVTAADYRGKIALLYFGYTFCPDVCPMTLSNIAQILKRLGPSASDIRVLFVTVDPRRDTLDTLRQYTPAFGPQVDGLRGNADQLAALAKRYRVAYSVDPKGVNGNYGVTHSSGIYVFDREGNARLLVSSLSSGKPDLAGTAADLKLLLE
jgi:protein SCO1/2